MTSRIWGHLGIYHIFADIRRIRILPASAYTPHKITLSVKWKLYNLHRSIPRTMEAVWAANVPDLGPPMRQISRVNVQSAADSVVVVVVVVVEMNII